jgi:ribosomal-protein-alanine acetyltransferase
MELERQNTTSAHWSQQQYDSLFAISVNSPLEYLVLVAVQKTAGKLSEILGFLVAQGIEAEWELQNIVVAESARRAGIGSLLLAELITHARAAEGYAIFLEVRQSNESARAFYRKIGFEETGMRNSYYSSPDENAVLYRLSL